VDFSSWSEAALVWAVAHARAVDAPLLVLHVVHDPEAAPGYYAGNNHDGHVERMEEAAAEMLERFLDSMRTAHPELAEIDVKPALAVGLPPTRIIEVAVKESARLIVVGSQGRSGLAHLLLGSKAQRVVQLSPLPVTVVKIPPSANSE
jgi:nucleotide-binding universal stress UspA family protein